MAMLIQKGFRMRVLLVAPMLALTVAGGIVPISGMAEEQPQVATAKTLVYKPPLNGAPARQVTGASRGAEEQTVLLPLAPDHVGFTTRPQPVFQWYAAGALNGKLEFTLNEGRKTVLETPVPLGKPGVQSLRLAEYRLSLKPGIEYAWRIALVADDEQRAADLIAGGAIRYEPASADLQAQIKKAKPQEKPAIYAGAGQWYDAVESLSALIAQHPQDKTLHDERAALLSQVEGLREAVDYDRQASR
ncbi:MAG: DUF928 domain-containing protein [Candidatus Competibacteraceae bacterium]|nr:DUF928 domain-containing protein [Candidatus Competibacteraceae bacterium]